MKHLLVVALMVLSCQAAFGEMVISEWMYNGAGTDKVGEYVEFTNIGITAIDMTGWSYDDSSSTPGVIDLSAFGTVAPGESVILTDDTAAGFSANWGITGVSIIGENTANLGRDDAIYLFDDSDTLIDQLTYDDEAGHGPRTQRVSCNIPASDYGYDIAQGTWVLATVGDFAGSWMSSLEEIGSPGVVPEPVSLTVLLLGGMVVVGRRR